MKQHVHVNLGSRSYEIVIAPGVLEQSKNYLQPIIANRRVAVVSDDIVIERYLPGFSPILDAVTERWDVYRIGGGEDAKSFAGLEQLLDAMLGAGIDRHSVVIAFGGGVVGDVAGFAAALLMRGIELIQIPTTLMSQVDSSVGGKNAINTKQGKNLVGSFLQPRIVLNDVSVLTSLPLTELQAGYGEIIKYGLLRGETEFAWLESNVEAIMRCDETALVEVIRMGCETKANIVSEDERDHGKRALVNLGHTFAHAFEAQAGFGHLLHGAAVAVGLIAACELSERMGSCIKGLAERVRQHTRQAGLPVDLTALSATTNWDAKAIVASMLHDKKTVNGKINFVLLKSLGDAFVSADVAEEDINATLQTLGAIE